MKRALQKFRICSLLQRIEKASVVCFTLRKCSNEDHFKVQNIVAKRLVELIENKTNQLYWLLPSCWDHSNLISYQKCLLPVHLRPFRAHFPSIVLLEETWQDISQYNITFKRLISILLFTKKVPQKQEILPLVIAFIKSDENRNRLREVFLTSKKVCTVMHTETSSFLLFSHNKI